MKPNLTVETLCASGFEHAATWIVSSDQLALDKPLSNVAGVYAFAIGDAVQYIGVATKGFARRAYSYVRPGPSQQTSIRLNSKIVELAAAGTVVDVYVASPENGEWNSLPVDMSAGLELGLIRHFDLPWNIRGAR